MRSKKVIPKEALKPYCGCDKNPRGYRKGTIAECAEKKQIRLYGLNKIDPKTLQKIKPPRKGTKSAYIPETREKLLLLLASLRGKYRTIKVRAENKKDKVLAKRYKDELIEVEDKIRKVIPKLQKIENARARVKTQPKKVIKKK
jgi:hypothetical protein